MIRKALTLAGLVMASALGPAACDASREATSVQDYSAWASARVAEMGTLVRELEAHALAANREPGLENERPWRERAEQLINATIAVTTAVRGWQAVPPEAADEHAMVLELAVHAETMVVNAAEAIANPTGPNMRLAIEGNSAFKRLEPETILALKDLAGGSSGE